MGLNPFLCLILVPSNDTFVSDIESWSRGEGLSYSRYLSLRSRRCHSVRVSLRMVTLFSIDV